MRLKVSKSKNAASFYVTKTVYENGKEKTLTVEKLGTEAMIRENHPDRDPYEWAKEYVAQLNQKEKDGQEPIVIAKFSPSKQLKKNEAVKFNGGYLFLQQIYHELGIDKICKTISKNHKFNFNLDNIMSRLVYGRILSPSSKYSTFEFSKTLLEAPKFECHQIYRALEIIAKGNDVIQAGIYRNSLKLSKRNDRVLYYDCTNFYFEIESEDEFKRYGHSKENRPNPIIQMGLFLDGDGIPLAFSLSPGNTNEQTTLKPLEKKIIKDFSNASIVVCTDAGLSSTENRKFNNINGRSFVTTQSIKKMKAYQKQWALSPEGWKLFGDVTNKTHNIDKILADEKSKERYVNSIFYKERWINEDNLEQRFVVTFSIKYMNYQKSIREKQILRASNLINNPSKLKKLRQSDPKRFITETSVTPDGEIAKKKIYGVNESQILQEEQYDGFYATATNLEDPAEDIVKINKGRWEIEESFRIMKSEFKARPVYLSREDRITAHFVTCFIALIIYKYLEKNTGYKYTCCEIINTLRDMHFQKMQGFGYVPAYTRTDITDAIHDAMGFRTDFEIVTNKMLKKIISASKGK